MPAFPQRFLLTALISATLVLVAACRHNDPAEAAKEIALGDKTVADSAKIKTLTYVEQEQMTDNLAFHYKAAIAHDGGNLDAYKKLAQVYYGRGRTLSCFTVLNKAKTLTSDDAEINAGIANFTAKSEAQIKENGSRDLGTVDGMFLAKLARCYFVTANQAKCRELMSQAVDRAKDDPYVLTTNAELHAIDTGSVLVNSKADGR